MSRNTAIMAEAGALFQRAQWSRAEKLFRKILQTESQNFDATFLLGLCLAQQNQYGPAISSFHRALEIRPQSSDAHYNLGFALYRQKRFDEALACYRKALILEPGFVEAHTALGDAFYELTRYDEAVQSYDRALTIEPRFTKALNNRGNALRETGAFEGALQSYARALAIEPLYADALVNRGIVLNELARFQEAVDCYDRALNIKPGDGAALNNRGTALVGLHRLEDALDSFNRSLKSDPGNAAAHANRAGALVEINRLEEAVRSYARAIELNAESDFIAGDFLQAEMKLCDWSNFDVHVREITKQLRASARAAQPFTMLAVVDAPDLQRRAASIFVDARCTPASPAAEIPRFPRHDRIRVGYFSADFRNHPVAHLMAGVFESHDRQKFDIHAFSFSHFPRDAMRERLESGFEHFHDVRTLSDQEISQRARQLEIDIAVDLMGLTQYSRPKIFAARAAAAQISFLGYPGTTGAEFIDYIFADDVVIRASHRQHYSERVIYLPHSFQPNDRARRISDRVFTRAEAGLPPQGFVFCCFNTPQKITPHMFDSWMRILASAPDAVLWLVADNPAAARNLQREAKARGVDPKRLIFAPRVSLEDYLARYKAADLFLDTAPFNAGATASDALWAGLPVLTLMGEAFAGRMAASLLHGVELQELVTATIADYETLAVALAREPQRIAEIKARLAANRLTAPLFDTRLSTEKIERAYVAVHERVHAGLPPDHIFVA